MNVETKYVATNGDFSDFILKYVAKNATTKLNVLYRAACLARRWGKNGEKCLDIDLRLRRYNEDGSEVAPSFWACHQCYHCQSLNPEIDERTTVRKLYTITILHGHAEFLPLINRAIEEYALIFGEPDFDVSIVNKCEQIAPNKFACGEDQQDG